MTPATLRSIIHALYGDQHGNIRLAADALGVSYDSLRQVLRGRRGVPPAWGPRLAALVEARGVMPPPDTLRIEDDRDGAAGEALDPHLDALMARAVASGWHPGEVLASALTWIIHRTVDSAGTDAARELIEGAAELVELERARNK